MRETAAARERNILFLAAVVGEDDVPARVTDTAPPEKTASGGLVWSEPTTTWDVNDLGPKPWWRAQYYYRARWYLPEGGVFGERDPLGYQDSVSFYQPLMNSPFNWNDPWGWSAVPTPPAPKPSFPFVDPDAVPEVPPGTAIDGIRGPRAPGMYSGQFGSSEGYNEGVLSASDFVRQGSDGSALLKGALELAESFVPGLAPKMMADKLIESAGSHHYSAGFSALSGAVAWPFAGMAGSANLQIFFNEGYYYVGLFGTESLADFKKKNRRYNERAGGVLAPVGVSGFGAGLSIGSVNVARARYGTPNTPKEWTGFFNSWTLNWGAYSGSVFWSSGFRTPFSARMRGVELGLGPGMGLFFTRQYYHPWIVSGALSSPQSAGDMVSLYLSQLR